MLSDVPETSAPKIIEQSPLIDPAKVRSCKITTTPPSRSLYRSTSLDSRNVHHRARTRLKPITEPGQQNGQAFNRSQSAPHYLRSPHYLSASPQHLRSPQYRVNPMVKFDERPFPERMNYGIAGYNTSRPRRLSNIPESPARPRSFSSVSESPARPRSFSNFSEFPARARSFSKEHASRPSSFSCIPESGSIQTARPVIWRSWTRRFRDKMGRIRVRETCSKFLSRFRG